MSIDYSVAALLTSVKQRAMTASNQNLFEDDDIVRIASEELQATILPFMESVKGEYFVNIKNTAYVSGVVNYTMPERATGSKLRDVSLIDNQGNAILVPYINPEDLKSSWGFTPYLFGYYPQDNQIVLVLGNNINAGNYSFVQMKFFRRPNVLCQTGASGNAGRILSFDTIAKTITLDAAPPSWTTATTFDIINSLPPFQSRGDGLTVTNVAGFVLTFTDALPSTLAVGDYVSEANFSPIPQIPVEAHRLLETLTAARMLQYSGDPSFQVFQQQAEAQKKDLMFILNPRVDGTARKFPIRNPLWGPF